MFERLRRDLQRLYELDGKGDDSLFSKVECLFHSPQFQAIALYRFARWTNEHVKARALRVPMKLAYHVGDKIVHSFWGVHIDEGADIGGGFYIGHAGGILIGPVKMGEDCNVSMNTLIGRRTDGSGTQAAPTFGDRVWIGVGCVIFGGIVIGDGVTIGPLTVVGRNIPPKSLVVGNPMQILKRNHDNTLQIYGKPHPTNGTH